jgi:hypothetical protein
MVSRISTASEIAAEIGIDPHSQHFRWASTGGRTASASRHPEFTTMCSRSVSRPPGLRYHPPCQNGQGRRVGRKRDHRGTCACGIYNRAVPRSCSEKGAAHGRPMVAAGRIVETRFYQFRERATACEPATGRPGRGSLSRPYAGDAARGGDQPACRRTGAIQAVTSGDLLSLVEVVISCVTAQWRFRMDEAAPFSVLDTSRNAWPRQSPGGVASIVDEQAPPSSTPR